MREILFRGKSLDIDEWVYGFYSGEDCEFPWSKTIKRANIVQQSSGLWFKVDPKTVGEFTGLTDMNGVKIFEGDIVQEKYERGVVRFGEYNDFVGKSHVGFYIQWNRAHLRPDILFWIRYRKIEVTGNIYDNPEILGGDDHAVD